jgi:hypothetical protein
MMKLLLEREGSEIEITEAVITAATKGLDKGIEVLRLLMAWSGNTGHVTEALLKEKEIWRTAHFYHKMRALEDSISELLKRKREQET